MGDGSVLEGETAISAAQAAQKMIKKRAKHFSNSIDYEKLKELFPEGGTPQGSGLGASPATSAGQQEAAPAPIAQGEETIEEDEDAEGEYEEEEEEEAADLEEEEDLNITYAEDFDEGFDESHVYDDY
jgi:transcription factor IIIB subunit 2